MAETENLELSDKYTGLLMHLLRMESVEAWVWEHLLFPTNELIAQKAVGRLLGTASASQKNYLHSWHLLNVLENRSYNSDVVDSVRTGKQHLFSLPVPVSWKAVIMQQQSAQNRAGLNTVEAGLDACALDEDALARMSALLHGEQPLASVPFKQLWSQVFASEQPETLFSTNLLTVDKVISPLVSGGVVNLEGDIETRTAVWKLLLHKARDGDADALFLSAMIAASFWEDGFMIQKQGWPWLALVVTPLLQAAAVHPQAREWLEHIIISREDREQFGFLLWRLRHYNSGKADSGKADSGKADSAKIHKSVYTRYQLKSQPAMLALPEGAKALRDWLDQPLQGNTSLKAHLFSVENNIATTVDNMKDFVTFQRKKPHESWSHIEMSGQALLIQSLRDICGGEIKALAAEKNNLKLQIEVLRNIAEGACSMGNYEMCLLVEIEKEDDNNSILRIVGNMLQRWHVGTDYFPGKAAVETTLLASSSTVFRQNELLKTLLQRMGEHKKFFPYHDQRYRLLKHFKKQWQSLRKPTAVNLPAPLRGKAEMKRLDDRAYPQERLTRRPIYNERIPVDDWALRFMEPDGWQPAPETGLEQAIAGLKIDADLNEEPADSLSEADLYAKALAAFGVTSEMPAGGLFLRDINEQNLARGEWYLQQCSTREYLPCQVLSASLRAAKLMQDNKTPSAFGQEWTLQVILPLMELADDNYTAAELLARILPVLGSKSLHVGLYLPGLIALFSSWKGRELSPDFYFDVPDFTRPGRLPPDAVAPCNRESSLSLG